MMIQSLKETFEAAERLSPEDQEALADEIDELIWERLIARPEAQEALEGLADRAEENVRAGRVKDLRDWLNELPD